MNGFSVHLFRAGALKSALDFFGFKTREPGRTLVVKRYRELSRAFHPDCPTGDAEKMKILNAHYDVLREAFPF